MQIYINTVTSQDSYFGTITEPGSPVLGAMIYHKNNIILCDTSYQQRCHMAQINFIDYFYTAIDSPT